MFISVDLPLPEGPMMDMNSFRRMRKDDTLQGADLLPLQLIDLLEVLGPDQTVVPRIHGLFFFLFFKLDGGSVLELAEGAVGADDDLLPLLDARGDLDIQAADDPLGHGDRTWPGRSPAA